MSVMVSIIVPCYNCSFFLEGTIQSIFDQTFKKWELILVDDGSKDNSLDVIRKYARFPKVRYISQQNRGVSAARNIGIEMAEGLFFYFLDADDLIHPDALQVLVDLAFREKNSISCFRVARFVKRIDNIIRLDPLPKHFWPDLIFANLAPLIAFLFPANLVKRTKGFNEKIFFAEDWEILLRFAFLDAKLLTTEFIGAYYRQHESSTCKTFSQRERLLGYIRVKETLCTGFLKRRDLLLQYGREAFWSAWGTLLQARRHSVSWNYLNKLSKELKKLARALVFAKKSTSFILLYSFLGARFCYKFTSLREERNAN